MKRLLLILQLGLIAITCNVNASIINSDTDDYKAYKDTETGLVWLDFGQNNNQSYNDVVSQLGAGNTWEGWRLPTLSEVYTMWANVADLDNVVADTEDPNRYGPGQLYASDTNSNIAGGDDSVWEDVFHMIGFNGAFTRSDYSSNYGYGFFDGTLGLSYVFFVDTTDERTDDTFHVDTVQLIDDDLGNPGFAVDAGAVFSTLLVRQADSPTTDLPAPSTIAILGLGLLGLVARRKLF